MTDAFLCATRRRVLFTSALMFAAAAMTDLPQAKASALPLNFHGGRINPPVPVPDVPVRLSDGKVTSLAKILSGRATALQLIFTGCSTTCPIQGAIFQRVQSLLPNQIESGIQLLSLSIDPLADTPQAMQLWLKRFEGRPGWVAATPDLKDLDVIQDFFGGGRNSIEIHATQVQIISRRGELIWRTYELPPAESIVDMLRKV